MAFYNDIDEEVRVFHEWHKEQCPRCKKWLKPLSPAIGRSKPQGDGHGYRKHKCEPKKKGR